MIFYAQDTTLKMSVFCAYATALKIRVFCAGPLLDLYFGFAKTAVPPRASEPLTAKKRSERTNRKP